MSTDEQRQHAGRVLDIAKEAITTVRGTQHGPLNASFDMIAEMWSTYINHAVFRATGLMPSPRITIGGVDVLRMMGQMKQARSVWGDPLQPDHYIDEAGYSALTAAYLGVVPPAALQAGNTTKPGVKSGDDAVRDKYVTFNIDGGGTHHAKVSELEKLPRIAEGEQFPLLEEGEERYVALLNGTVPAGDDWKFTHLLEGAPGTVPSFLITKKVK